MGLTLAQKIIKSHLVSGKMEVGEEIALRIDQTLTQDATGTMAYLEFETMGLKRVKTERSVAYIDHNTLQCGFEKVIHRQKWRVIHSPLIFSFWVIVATTNQVHRFHHTFSSAQECP